MKLKIFSTLATVLFFAAVFMSADHIDAPKVTNSSQDIADFFVFQGANQNNLVFATTVQGLLSPGTTAAATFDENTLIEFNIDTDGDNVEDLVIQAIPRDGKMIVFGPVAPSMKGTESSILSAATRTETEITLTAKQPKQEATTASAYLLAPVMIRSFLT